MLSHLLVLGVNVRYLEAVPFYSRWGSCPFHPSSAQHSSRVGMYLTSSRGEKGVIYMGTMPKPICQSSVQPKVSPVRYSMSDIVACKVGATEERHLLPQLEGLCRKYKASWYCLVWLHNPDPIF